MMQPAAITKAQIKAIHVAIANLNMDDAAYREKLRLMFDVTTCKALSRRQATILLKALGLPAPKRASKPKPASQPASQPPVARSPRAQGDNVIALCTAAQMKFIADLKREIFWHEDDGFQRWLGFYMSISRVRTKAEAARVIEGLKAVKQRQRGLHAEVGHD